ncbi:MAG: polyprenyl synthetase family protein [Actinomycetota bacterium]
MTPHTASKDISAQVERVLVEFLDARAEALPDAADLIGEINRVAGSGGKRLRPAFCVWGYRAAGGTDDVSITRVAAALELLHTFAIVHDDVMDQSQLRRGEPTTYRRLSGTPLLRRDRDRFGESAAILVGDLAMAFADELWGSSGFEGAACDDASTLYHAMRAEVIGGQYLDLLAAARGRATLEETRRISVLKSGRYTVERPLLIGATFAGASEDVREALAAFGAPLGEAFQLRDDVLGAFGDPNVTGKDADGDLREGKQTLLVALARGVADPAQRAVLDARLGAADLDSAGAEELRTVFRDTGALRDVLASIEDLAAAARAALKSAPIPPVAAAALAGLAEYVSVRSV